MSTIKNLPIRALLLLTLCLAGCESAYYGAMEKVGFHKRDILVDRIDKARQSQEEAKEEFRSALERFSYELGFDGGDLQDKYEALNDAYENAKAEADNVSARIDAVQSVADALFEEWQSELEEYSSAKLKRDSQSKLRSTKAKYKQMLVVMRAAEARMEPVLTTFNDQVLYLKHNLNARAITSLKTEFKGLEKNIEALIHKMEASIKEAESFVNTLNAS